MAKLFKSLVVLAMLGAAGYAAFSFLAPHKGRRPPEMATPVRAAQALAQHVPHYLQGLGTVQPHADVVVTSRVSGHLMALHFTEGQRVKQGQLLAEIDPRPFEAALSKAKGQLARDQAELANARVDRNRYAKLVSKDFVARQTFDQQDAKVRQLEGTVASDKAAVEAAALDLAYSRITAPVAGRLGLRSYDIGTMVTANDAGGLVRITEVAPCYVVFTLPESNIDLITQAIRRVEGEVDSGKEPQMPLVEAWSRDQSKRIALGRLLTVDNRIDQATGTIKLKAVFPNEDESLFPNEFVNARIRIRTLDNAVTIPPSAVQLGTAGSFVFVVDAENTARKREVKTGISTGAITVIESGLKAGETVVVDGVDRLRDGTKVRVAAVVETVRMPDGTRPHATEKGPEAIAPMPQGGAPAGPGGPGRGPGGMRGQGRPDGAPNAMGAGRPGPGTPQAQGRPEGSRRPHDSANQGRPGGTGTPEGAGQPGNERPR